MRALFSALAVTAAFVALPAAAAGLTNEKAQIETLTAANVSEVLTELGAGKVQAHDSNGKTIISFEDGGIPYNAGIHCDKLGCTSLVLLVSYNTGTRRFPLEALNSINRGNLNVAVVQYDEDSIHIGRVTFTDGGVAKKNIAVNVGTFVNSVREALASLSSQVTAGYQPGAPARFQPAGMAGYLPRPVAMSPAEVARVMDQMNIRKR
jgi:hypothetical protein